MKNKITALYQRWIHLKPLSFIFISTLLMIILTIPIKIVFAIIDIPDSVYGGPDVEKYGIAGLVFMALIAAPVFETLIGQQLPIFLSQRFIKQSPNIIGVTFSTILFSWMHSSYSIWYAIAVIPAGLLLANTFIIFQKRKESSFWMTSFLHSFKNAIPVIILLIDRIIK
jgi:membrane protease YdiL (CAAX protease family)